MNSNPAKADIVVLNGNVVFNFRKTPGPIRSLLGKCIHVPQFAFGAKLQMYDCYDTSAQVWVRPTVDDLRLKTYNNMCMDAYNYPGAGGAVILNTCNDYADSQRWLYNGRNLRPMYNTGLCMTIAGGASTNIATLILSACDNGSASAWIEYVKPTAKPTKVPTVSPMVRLSVGPTKKRTAKPTTQITTTIFRVTMGPIRSLLGRCIDGGGGEIYQQLAIRDCNDESNQLWIRPTSSSTDLRLQTQSNKCMDALGSPGAGGPVILNTCNDIDAQKWIYDGRNLRPKYNTGLCLSILGGDALGAALVVSACDNGPLSAWVEYSISSLSGGTGGGRGVYLCPVGSKVIQIGGYGGWWVDWLVMTCDDDSRTVIGPRASDGGGTMPVCTSGYTVVNVTSGTLVGNLNLFCSNTGSWKGIGGAISNGSGPTTSLVLFGDQRVIGMQMNSETYVNAIALVYSSTSAWPQTVSPMVFPTMKPTSKPTGRKPSFRPTKKPSRKPTKKPSKIPTVRPTKRPSRRPTKKPSRRPTKKPSRKPTKTPSRRPTKKPSKRPTKKPSRKPSVRKLSST